MDRLEVGDVITYLPPPDSDVTNLVTHRIVSARRTRSGNIAFRTQGDANPDPDPWTFSLTGRTVAKVGAAADWTPPAVSLTSPGSPVKDTVNLTATATDGETGIKSVTIEYLPVDGSAWSTVCTVGTAPYTCSWDSKSVPDGSYDLRARATDNAGYASTSPTVRTTVANKLLVVLDAPGDVVRGTVSLSTTVYNSGSTTYTVRVEYSPSGANSWKPICTNLSAPYACSWVTTTFGNDYVDLRAVAVAGGTATSSAPVTDVLVDNEAPTVTMIDPGTPLSGARTFAVDARDANSGVAKVVIQYANRGHDDVQDTLHADRGAHLVQLRHRRAVRRHLQLPRRRDGPSRQRDHLSGGRQPDRGQHGVLGVNGRPGRPPQRHGVAVRHGELVRRRDLGEDPVRAERIGIVERRLHRHHLAVHLQLGHHHRGERPLRPPGGPARRSGPHDRVGGRERPAGRQQPCDHGAGDISVETSDTGPYLCVRVSDEGGEELDHEVFRRGVSGDGGTGVGLAVATELAESLGGRLVLDDGPLTGFALRLPRLAEPATARQSLESRPDRRALRGSSGC